MVATVTENQVRRANALVRKGWRMRSSSRAERVPKGGLVSLIASEFGGLSALERPYHSRVRRICGRTASRT